MEKHPEHRSIVYKSEEAREKARKEKEDAKGKGPGAGGLYDEEGKLVSLLTS